MTEQGPALGRPLVRLAEIGSTQDVAKALAAAGAPEGTVVVAAEQTHGRGRHGREWISPAGGLWCSVVLRPPRAPDGVLSLAVGVAAAEAAERAGAVSAGLRWPNDLIVAGRKVGGVLLEGDAAALIVGIGVNATVDHTVLPPGVAAAATSLHAAAGREVSVDDLLDALLDRLRYWYGVWRRAGPEVALAWRRRDILHGVTITANTGGRRVEGVAEGVDAAGALLVRTADGSLQRVIAGDVGPRARAARE